ncbi:MAG TPA: saccharopine dehydrogenase C-terminal domain-containing protein [Rubricoccaceae bacterium]|jgi:saccharopine dehydrogenase-like NADP-dependent oxidoreductase
MKITVLGAGAIGSAVAYDLCRRPEVARVQVCEAQPVTLRAYRSAHAHPNLRTYEADARDAPTLEPILAGSAVVVSCVGPEHSGHLARLALDLGAHFVDLGGPDGALDDAPALSDLAERRQRHVVTGCGLAPGLAGILAMRGLARFETATAARIRVGDVPTDPDVPFRYRLAHSADKLLNDYTQPATVLRDGCIETRTPLTGVETLEVDGLGTMEAFYTGGGIGTLAEALEGRLARLDAKTLRFPGHADQMRFLLDLGLADRTSLDVRTHLSYRDVLVRRLRQRLGGAYNDAVIVRVEIEGEVGGEDGPESGTLIYEIVDRFDEASGLSAMQRCTGFPAAAAAVMLGARMVPGGGVGPAEQVLPFEPFFASLAERGIAVTERWVPAHETAEA